MGRFPLDLGLVSGTETGQLDEPNGVAVTSAGHVFVADTVNGRVQEFDEHGAFVRDWPAPDRCYGPRDLAVAPDDTVYVLDQGHSASIRLPATGPATTIGRLGGGPGQLNDPTGLAVAGTTTCTWPTLAMTGSGLRRRRQVRPARSRSPIVVDPWRLPGRRRLAGRSRPLRLEPDDQRVLVFTIDGRRTGSLKPAGADALYAGPGALAVRPDGRIVVDFDGSRVSELAPPP